MEQRRHRSGRTAARIGVLALTASTVCAAQQGVPVPAAAAASAPEVSVSKFEVASIRRNKAAEEERALREQAAPGAAIAPGRARTMPGGIVMGQAMTLREMIRDAYGYRNNPQSDVTGGPGWLDSERFDVMAKVPMQLPLNGIIGLPPEAERLLRALLEERFKVKVHRETRERPVYELVLAHKDGRLGGGIMPTKGECRNFYAPAAVLQPDGGIAIAPLPSCDFRLGGGVFLAGGFRMPDLARFMQAWPTINTTVIDKTGLMGIYDVTVRFRSASDLSAATSSSSELPLFTEAIEPQLGLKLQRARGPVEMLIVDSAERPTEN